MAQLKIKQISDFVTGVEAKINALVGTSTGTAISTAKSEAISTAVSADAVVLSSAKSYADVAEADAVTEAGRLDGIVLSSANSYADVAEADAVKEADRLDGIVLSSAKSYADQAEADAVTEAGRLDGIVLSSAKSYADQAEADALQAAKDYSDIQKLRINALLLDSEEALDTFAEIQKFIQELETADIVGLTNDISNSKSLAISTAVSADAVVLSSAKSYADQAEADAVTEAGRLDGIVLSSAKSYADQAEADAVTEAGRLDGIVLSSAKSYADQAEADAISTANTYTDDEIAKLDIRLDGLEGVGFEEEIAVFGDVRNVSTSIAFDTENVKVFVNGLQIHELGAMNEGWTSVDGQNFVFKLPYDLEATDHVVISGKRA